MSKMHELMLELVELGKELSGLRAENKLLKEQNAFLKTLIPTQPQKRA